MKPLHVVVGMGEVGKALAEVLRGPYDVYEKDIDDKEPPKHPVQTMHVALNYYAIGHDRWVSLVAGYLSAYNPRYLDVCSTVRPGTTEVFGKRAVHSTTRGLHPNLASGLMKITKHIGGPAAQEVARQYAAAGVPVHAHRSARTTELLHILNNTHYGVNLMFADEAQRLCREYGVDYQAYLKYTETHNAGFSALDHERLVRPILHPPYGRIGGHCVTQGASLIDEEKSGLLVNVLARYNDPESRDRFLRAVLDEAAEIECEHIRKTLGAQTLVNLYVPEINTASIGGAMVKKEPGSSVAEQPHDRRQAAGSIPAPATDLNKDSGTTGSPQAALLNVKPWQPGDEIPPLPEPPPGCQGDPDHGSAKPCPVYGCEDDHAEKT